ncbi:thermonuclease family protein [Microbacterium fluvii]|uniref:Thermonuclease family protein n=1 Tax=Microbacterium fluvii TaxID=415215 RepID=A0ABW2H7P5_9MICO|nr:thermonuclease family protein [Microbacterium fluvii]MCU4671026.1 thermonuclease family protein [Microbacterium fluvii]
MRSRRRGRGAIAVLAVAVVAIGVGWASFQLTAPAGEADAVATASDLPARPDDAVALTVASVWDGDTLRAVAQESSDLVGTDEIKIRLIGIDTPERSPDEECGAMSARDDLLALAPVGSTIWAAPDADPLDRYDRWLFYLWTDDGRFINYELTASGAAEPMSIEPNTTYEALFEAGTAQARADGVGRWGACG